MSSRNTKIASTPTTRSSTRTKTPAHSHMTGARTTRAGDKTQDATRPLDVVGTPITTPARKPLWNRDNAITANTGTVKKPAAPKSKTKAMRQAQDTEDPEREPIKAFLRIRPQSSEEEPASTPYLSALSDTAVQMTDPSPSMSRLRPVSSQSTYTFSKVFLPESQQPQFFIHTALPLVRDLLNGQNGLLFAYGVTNSGKTYTIQGGGKKGEGGLLPRTLDVVFNSVDGLHSDAPFRPVRLAGVEYDGDGVGSVRSSIAPFDVSQKPFDLPLNADQSILASVIAEQIDSEDRDETVLKVDRNYEYSVWVSYAEIYNEKVFDLLGVSSTDPTSPGARIPYSTSTLTLPRSHSTISGFTSCANLAALASTPTSTDFNNPLLVKRKALALKSDPEGGKYIAGLREVRVRSAEEAKAIVKMGQINRRVFGTLANRASSRSHGIFTVKIMKVHKGCPEDPESFQTARLSIVDLAGSERANNTHNTGERLKEAGNINKSLMVLGQCMEALRTNQRKLATGSSSGPNVRLGLVPFRHSKLTELFQDFFVGDGRAVMIVNVNPYDTGFDENSHVMKFSALARDVSTTTVKRVPSSIPRLAPHTNRRQVTISTGGKAGTRVTETYLDVLEEDEEFVDDDDSEPANPLVDALFERVEELRVRVFESEMRCALIESETRDEVMKEMEERMMCMERMFTKRLMSEVAENQLKTDRKIDMLHQAGLLGVAARQSEQSLNDLEDELRVDDSLVVESDDELVGGPSPSPSLDLLDGATASSSAVFQIDGSPLAAKGQLSRDSRIKSISPDIGGDLGLFDDGTEDEAVSSRCSTADEEYEDVQSQDGDIDSGDKNDEEDSEWAPEAMADTSPESCKAAPKFRLNARGPLSVKIEQSPSPKLAESSLLATAKKSEAHAAGMTVPPASPLQHKTSSRPTQSHPVPVEEERMDHLTDGFTDNVDDSTIIIPNRQARKYHAGEDAEYISRSGEVDDAPKKKKRVLGKKIVVTEDEIEAVTCMVSKVGLGSKKQANVRRLTAKGNK